MGNYPLTAKEQHKRKEKLAKIRQTVMIILMAVAGLYYMTVERSRVTNAAIMTNVDESTVKTNGNQDKEVQETKFKIESYLQPETTDDETCQTILQEIETPIESQLESTEKTLPDANQITQIIPSTAVDVTDASMMVTQKESIADPTVVPGEDKRVNLNTATLEELDALPGVGPSTAKNIIAYREAHGGFAAPEEIMNVKRIGEKTFGKLKEFIKV
jgi:comEA protein